MTFIQCVVVKGLGEKDGEFRGAYMFMAITFLLVFFIIAIILFFATLALGLFEPTNIQIQNYGIILLLFSVVFILSFPDNKIEGFIIALLGLIVGTTGFIRSR